LLFLFQIEEYLAIQGVLSLTNVVRKRSTTTLSQLLFAMLYNTSLLTYTVVGQMTLPFDPHTSWCEEDLDRLVDCLSQYAVAKCWAENDKKVPFLY